MLICATPPATLLLPLPEELEFILFADIFEAVLETCEKHHIEISTPLLLRQIHD